MLISHFTLTIYSYMLQCFINWKYFFARTSPPRHPPPPPCFFPQCNPGPPTHSWLSTHQPVYSLSNKYVPLGRFHSLKQTNCAILNIINRTVWFPVFPIPCVSFSIIGVTQMTLAQKLYKPGSFHDLNGLKERCLSPNLSKSLFSLRITRCLWMSQKDHRGLLVADYLGYRMHSPSWNVINRAYLMW